ncbi:DHH family phosphoesterase [Marinilabiliaceae bacterium ANBcel2]|nr:DHH family phosphoesterase [Marinilabiliaceae bacterium ANBcel2]
MTLFKEKIETFKSLLNRVNIISVIPHKSPDGDAIGSGTALVTALKLKGYDVKLIVPDEIPPNLCWMYGADDALNYEKSCIEAEKRVDETELLIFLDFNTITRTGDKLSAKLNRHKERIDSVCIDHHPYPDFQMANLFFSDTTVSSTCELIFNILKELQIGVNREIAESLYAGIMTDTGMLNHNSSRFEIYNIVGELVKHGVDKEKVHKLVFHSHSFDRMKLLGHALCNKMELTANGRAAFIVLSYNDLKKFNYKTGDTEGLVNYPLSIDKVLVSALITEKEKNIMKLSFRSRGDIHVNKYSEINFSGGGHRNAAGGEMKGDLNKVVDVFNKTVEEFINNSN